MTLDEDVPALFDGFLDSDECDARLAVVVFDASDERIVVSLPVMCVALSWCYRAGRAARVRMGLAGWARGVECVAVKVVTVGKERCRRAAVGARGDGSGGLVEEAVVKDEAPAGVMSVRVLVEVVDDAAA